MRLGLFVAALVAFAPSAALAEIVQPASPIDRPAPDYPDQAGGAEGYVKLHFTVDKTGHLKDVQPFESSPQGVFDAAAIAAVSHWSYHPRTVDGQAVDQPGNAIVLRFTPGADRLPVWLNPSPVYYPREAYKAKAEGSVKVGYDIDERGMVGNIHVVSSTLPGVFDDAAIDNVKNRVFRPLLLDGKPTADGGLVATLDFKLADAKILPKVLHAVPPKYPKDADEHQIEGYCAMEFTIKPDGSVADPKVVASYPSGVFDRESLDVITGWKFQPPETSDGPVASVVRYTFTYTLGGSPD